MSEKEGQHNNSLQIPESQMNPNDLSDSEKTSIQVSIRIRPLSDKEIQENDVSCVKIDPNYPNSITLEANSFESKMFCFDYVAHQYTPQQEVFNKVALPAAESCLEGYNGCIFAYGQTGAGKTYTITGSSNIESVLHTEHRGMLPRVLEYIFQKIKQQQSLTVEYLVKCSYLEIYNEHIIDLLSDNGTNLQLREDLKKGVYVEGLSEQVTQNLIEAINILKVGGGNRHNGATSMNRESSRSHSVFSIILQSKTLSEGVTHIRYSRFHFVDLAGSERIKQTNAIGDRLKEGCNINKSLSILGNVINALVEVDNGRARHIHYRDSKLTFFLKDSLGGNSKTRVIANVSPASSAFQETLSTLKFAKRAKLIKNKVQINEDHSGNVDALNNEIKKLRLENIQFRDMLQKGVPPSFFSGSQPGSPINRGSTNIDFSKANSRYLKEENIKMQETEELCQHYLEQAQEIELKMNYNMGKTKDQLLHLIKYVETFQKNEYQYRSIIKLQRAKIERLEELLKNKSLTKEQVEEFFNEDKERTTKELNDLKDLLENQMYCTKLFSENVNLQQQVERIQEPGKSIYNQLTQNVEVLKNLQDKLEHNVEQRVRLQKVIEDLEENKKNSTPDRSKKLEYQLSQIEKDHIANVDHLNHEILQQKQRLNDQERAMDDLVGENHRLTRQLEQLNVMQEFKQAQHEETVHQLKKLINEKSHSTDEKNSEMHLRNIDLTEQIKQLQQQNLVLNEKCKECEKSRSEMAEEKKQAHEKYLKYLEKYNEETTLLQASIQQLTSNFNEKEFENLRIKEETNQYVERIQVLELKANQAKINQEQLQSEIEEKSAQIESLEEQMVKLEEAENERQELQEEIETLTETLNFRENELEEMKKQKIQVQTQLIDLQNDKEQVELELKEVHQRIEELESGHLNSTQAEQREEEIQKFEDEIKKLEEEIQRVQDEKITIEQNLNEVQEEKNVIQQKLDEVQEEKFTIEIKLNEAQEEKEQISISLEEVQQKFEQKVETFKQQVIELEEKTKTEKVETIQQCKKDLHQQSKQMKEKFREELEMQIQIREKKISRLEDEVKTITQQNKQIMDQQTEQIQIEAQQIKIQYEQLKQESEQVKIEYEQFKIEAEQIKTEAEQIKEEAEQMKIEVEVQQQKIEKELTIIQVKSKDEIQKHQNSIHAYEQQIQELESSILDKETEAVEKNNILNKQQKKIREQESEITKHNEQLEEQKQNISQLTEQLQGQAQQYLKAKSEVEKLQKEIFSQQEKILDLENTLKKLKEKQISEASELEKYNLELEDKVRQLEDDNSNMVKLNSQMQMEYEDKITEKDSQISEILQEKKNIENQKLIEIEKIVKLQQKEKGMSLQQQEILFIERITELENQIKEIIQDKESFVVQQEEQNNEKDNQIDIQQLKIDEMVSNIEEQNQEIQNLNSEVVHLRQKISQKEKEKQEYIERENKERQQLTEKLIEEKESLQNSLEKRFQAKQEQLEEKIYNYQEQIEQIKEDHSSQIEQKNMIIEEHQSIIDELNQQIQQFQTQRSQQLSNQEQLYEQSVSENRLFIKQIENLKKEIVNKTEELAIEREELEQLQKDHEQKLKQIQEKHVQEIRKVEMKSRDSIVAAENHWEEASKKVQKQVDLKQQALNEINEQYAELDQQFQKEQQMFEDEKNQLLLRIEQLESSQGTQIKELNSKNQQIIEESNQIRKLHNEEQLKLEQQVQQLQDQIQKQNINLEEERSKFLQKWSTMLKDTESNTQKQVLLCEALRDEKFKSEKEELIRTHQQILQEKENELFEKNQELLETQEQLEELKVLIYTYETKQKEIQESNEKQVVLNTSIYAKQIDQLNSDKVSLKKNIEVLNQKIAEKINECQKVTIQNGEYISKVSQQEQTIHDLELKVSQISKNIQQQDSYIQKTAQELQQKKDIIQTINEEYSKLIQQNESLKHQLSDASSQLEKQATVQKQKEIERIEFRHKSQIEDVENKHNEELNKIFEERRIMLEQLEEQKQLKDTEMEEIYQKYAEEIDNFKKLTKNLQNQNEYLEKENLEKEELCNQLSNALNGFKQELNKRDDLLYLQEEQEKLLEVNKILENDLEKKTKMIEESKINLIQAKRDMQEMKKILEMKNKEIENQKNELKEFYEKTQVFAQTRDKDVKEVKDQYSKLLDEHNKIMSQFSDQSEKMDKLKCEVSDYAKEKALINQEIRKLQSNEKKLKAQLNDMHDENKRMNEERNQLLENIENLQKEMEFNAGGHNNPDQKIKLFNKIKEENTLLKNEKKEIQTVLAQLTEDNKQLMKQIEQLHMNNKNNPLKNIANFRQSTPDAQLKLELDQSTNENKRLQDIILQTISIIHMSSNNKGQKQQPRQSIDKELISGVKQIVSEVLEKENKIKDLSKDLDTKTIKYSEIEKKYLQLQLNIKDSAYINNLNNLNRERSKDRVSSGIGGNQIIQQQGPFSSYNQNQINNNTNNNNQNFQIQQQPSYSSYLQNPIKNNQYSNQNQNSNLPSMNNDKDGNNYSHINNSKKQMYYQ